MPIRSRIDMLATGIKAQSGQVAAPIGRQSASPANRDGCAAVRVRRVAGALMGGYIGSTLIATNLF
jgi:hypothetical protein